MPWSDALVEPLAGDVIFADDVHEEYEAVKAITDAWTSYTPVWTAATTNPVIGNGTIAGKYFRSGKLVQAAVDITMGSTTTYGTGAWRVSLPITAAGTGPYLGVALIFDGTDANRRAGAAYLGATTYCNFAADGTVAAAVPITWSTGDVLRFSITYEAA